MLVCFSEKGRKKTIHVLIREFMLLIKNFFSNVVNAVVMDKLLLYFSFAWCRNNGCCLMIADIEFEHRCKRRRILREPSISPVAVDNSRESDIGLTYPSHSSPLRDVSGVSGKELLLQAVFLSLHGLQPCDPHLKQSKLQQEMHRSLL